MKSKLTGSGLTIEAETGDERAALEAFVKRANPTAMLGVAEVTHKSDQPEGPTEIRIDWQAKA